MSALPDRPNLVALPGREQPTGREKRVKMQRRRKELGFTQYQVAIMTGLTVTSIANLESGRVRHPRYVTMAAIAQVLSCEVNDLREAWERSGIPATDPTVLHTTWQRAKLNLTPSELLPDDFIPRSIKDEMDLGWT